MTEQAQKELKRADTMDAIKEKLEEIKTIGDQVEAKTDALVREQGDLADAVLELEEMIAELKNLN